MKLFFAWYDAWVGVFYDRKNRITYVCLLPCICLKIWRYGMEVLIAFMCGLVIASLLLGIALSTARQRNKELEGILKELGGSLNRVIRIYEGRE